MNSAGPQFVQTRADKPLLYFALLFFLGVCLLSAGNPFFWDNILNARIATIYLLDGFSTLVPPAELDAGHPPGFNFYLALVWRIFGRSLPVSHLAMLPFLMGIVIYYWRLVCRFIPPKGRLVAMLLLVLEPTLLAQSTQVSPDIVLLFGLLAAINYILSGKRILLMLVLCVVGLVSFRGILILPGIVLIDILFSPPPRISLKRILSYFPVTFLVLFWWWVHLSTTGWMIAPPDETYGSHREAVDLGGILKNLGVMAWRLLDQGRIVIWLSILFLFIAKTFKKVEGTFKVKPLLMVLFILTGTWMLFFIPLSNPIGHRYWMITFLVGNLVSAFLIAGIQKSAIRTLLSSAFAIALISGHFWLYPEPIAKGWDSTLAHVSWFGVQKELDDYITSRGLRAEICTDFPNVVNRGVSTLNDSLLSRKDLKIFNETGLGNCNYVAQSNVMNGFEAADLKVLATDFELMKEFRSGFVYARLYQKK